MSGRGRSETGLPFQVLEGAIRRNRGNRNLKRKKNNKKNKQILHSRLLHVTLHKNLTKMSCCFTITKRVHIKRADSITVHV